MMEEKDIDRVALEDSDSDQARLDMVLKFAEVLRNGSNKCDSCGKEHSTNLKKCSRCKIVVYCNRDCQRRHWPQHKGICDGFYEAIVKTHASSPKQPTSARQQKRNNSNTGRTDCCIYGEVSAICPDCNHKICENCEVTTQRGMCWCEHSLRGDAHADQADQENRDFLRNIHGYRGKFKPLIQVQMEKDLVGNDYGEEPKARVDCCGYRHCNFKPGDKYIQCTKLTDQNIANFIICEVCKSKAYCSESCREKDRTEKTRDLWTGDESCHAELCEPYVPQQEFPYVSVRLRQYKEKFGRFPHPLGGEDVFA